MIKLNEWVCTDPNNDQWGRWLGGRLFEFKEPDFDGDIVQFVVDLNSYTDEEVQKHISAYYRDVEEVKEIYGDSCDWVIAECIFEQETGMY